MKRQNPLNTAGEVTEYGKCLETGEMTKSLVVQKRQVIHAGQRMTFYVFRWGNEDMIRIFWVAHLSYHFTWVPPFVHIWLDLQKDQLEFIQQMSLSSRPEINQFNYFWTPMQGSPIFTTNNIPSWRSFLHLQIQPMGPRTIWHQDNLAPRTIWHRPCWRTIWHHSVKVDNLAPRTIWHRGQFGTMDNLAP